LGQQIRQTIESWGLPVVSACRGLGLLIGIGLNTDLVPTPEGKTPALVVVEALRQEGLLSVAAGPNTVRLLPPLNVKEEEVEQALTIIKKTLKGFCA
jgi:acetylornithine/succinyldiaminopimelate/putrescine aminotransferase